MVDMKWKGEHESILVDWADKAQCYRWMHRKAHDQYSRKNMWFTIPVIILSTITGTANFAQERISEEYRSTAVMAIGGLNIFAGVLTTIQQFLKISEINEAHRVASVAWDKFHRNIRVELTKHPDQRTPVSQMLKVCKEEFDRLMETCPPVSDKVAKEFVDTFKGNPEYSQVVVPDICGVLRPSDTARFRCEQEEPKDGADSSAQEREQWRQTFVELHGREPLEDEFVSVQDNSS